jgi:phosphoglycolate phosphatase
VQILRAIPLHQIRLLVFDLDGTLIDSRTDLVQSVNATMRHFGRKDLPGDVIASYIGDGASMLVRRALGDPDDEHLVTEALTYFVAYYREHKLDFTTTYPGVLDSLAILAAQPDPPPMAVLTNKPVGPSIAIVNALGLAPYFFRVYGGDSFHSKKPDPHGLLTLIREAGTTAEQTIMIGDSDVDVLTAQNAGVWSVGCLFGLAPHTLATDPPDVLVDTPDEWPFTLARYQQS